MVRNESERVTRPVARHDVLRWVRALGVGCLLTGLAVAAAPGDALAGASWRQPGYGRTNQSYNPDEATITADNVPTLVERWRVTDLEGSIRQPVTADGRIFVVRGDTARALSVDDGRELWRQTYTEGDPENCCGLSRPIVLNSGRLLVELSGSFGGGLASFDPVTGDVSGSTWFHAGMDEGLYYEYGSGGPLLVTLGTEPFPSLVYFGDLFNSPRFTAPMFLGDKAFVGVNSAIGAFDVLDCQQIVFEHEPLPYCGTRWVDRTLPGAATTPVGFRRDKVAVASKDGTLRVYNAATGEIEWSATVPSAVAFAPAVARHRIYVPETAGVIRAFDSRGCGSPTCSPINRYKLGGAITVRPVVAGDVLYAGTAKGRLLAFRANGCGTKGCRPLWSIDTGDAAITSGPIVAGGMLFAGTADGKLLAYGLPD